jgi:PAS domain S-box-containing protein
MNSRLVGLEGKSADHCWLSTNRPAPKSIPDHINLLYNETLLFQELLAAIRSFMIYTPFIWPQLIAGIILAGIAVYVRRFRDAPGARSFSLLIWLIVLWILIYTLSISTVLFPLKFLWYQVQLLPVLFLPPVILATAMDYIDQSQWLTRKNLTWMLAVPVIASILMVTSPYHHLFRYDFRMDLSGPVTVMLSAKGPLFWVYVAYAVILILIACGLLLTSFRIRTLHFRNASLIAVGLLLPLVVNLLSQFDLTPIRGFDWTPISFVITGILYIWALWGSHLFDISPVARNIVLDNIEDIVIVFDTRGHIIDFNRAAKDRCDLSKESIGLTVDRLPSHWAALLQRYQAVADCKEEVLFSSDEGQFFYELTISSILDKRNRTLGRLFLLHDISKRKQVEQDRHESETRYQMLIELLPDGVVMHRNGQIIFANSASVRLIGAKTVDELLGRHVLDFVHPDSRQVVIRRLQQIFQENQPVSLIEEKFVRLDGSTIDVEVASRPLQLGEEPLGLSVFHDITVRKQAEEKLKQLSRAVEQSPASIVITDPTGSIQYVNPKFSQVTGYSLEEALNQNPRILKSGNAPPEFYKNMWETITSGEEWRGEFLNRKKNGDLYWEAASISPITDLSGKITYFVAVKEDITERKQAEAALQQYAGELRARNEELDAFAHTVAHDLKDPIGIVASYSDLMLDQFSEQLPPQAQNLLRRIRQNTDRLTRIIAELMLLAGVRKQKVLVEVLRMAAILDEVQERLTIPITRSNAQIVILGETEGHGINDWPPALGYAPWIEEIWTNFISNAIHYGGIPPHIELGAILQENKKVRFFVRDNGQGLSEAEQEKLFTPFTRLSQAQTSGHGLGLSIVRSIAEKLNGEVGVESAPGKGSTFYFVLPQAPADGVTENAASSTAYSITPISTIATQIPLPGISLEGMPSEWLADLLQAAQAGDIQQIHQLAESIRREWPEIAYALDNLMENFDYRTLLLMIQQAA